MPHRMPDDDVTVSRGTRGSFGPIRRPSGSFFNYSGALNQRRKGK